MVTDLLGNHYVQLALSLGSIIGGAYSVATALTKRMELYHAYIRRVLSALIYGAGLGVITYIFDKRLDYFYERLISNATGITLPGFTYGVATGVFYFLALLATPKVRDGEKINPQFLLVLYALVAGIGTAVFFPVGAIFLIDRYHWFGWTLNGVALLIILGVGFILGVVIGFYGGSPLARGDDESAGTRGCILQVIGLILGIPAFIAFGQIMGWGPFLLYMAICFGVGIVLAILSAVVEVMPSWVLAAVGIILVALFAVVRGYETIATTL